MAKVTGIGGIFFKSANPENLYQWYEKHLGIKRDESGGAMFKWRDTEKPDQDGMTVWSVFPASTKYFNPSNAPFMVNYRVDDLNSLIAQMQAAGVEVEHREDEYGHFAWVMDPD